MRDAKEAALRRLVPRDEKRTIYLMRWVDTLGLTRAQFTAIFPQTERLITSRTTYTFGWIRENVVHELLRYRYPEGFGQDAMSELKSIVADGMLAIVLADEDVQAKAC